MSAETKKKIELKIAHVLFLDIVGYSKLPLDEEHRVVEALNQIVRQSETFRAAETAGRLLKIPTGDGMVLVFSDSPEQPVECALEISRSVRSDSSVHLRMGIHSGPVSGVVDVNERANVAGAGINMAQRTMDCGDAGHILLSKHVAEDLEHYPQWKPHLHDLGQCKVKHGVPAHVINLYTEDLGNPKRPAKFRALRRRKLEAFVGVILALLVLAGGAALVLRYWHSEIFSTAAIPEKSIAVLPFENLSEDKANAYFAAGIQDEILTRLANLRALKVISRTSTEKYQSHPPNLKTVGSELGVANILEGSVQKLANDVHINVQLIKATTDDHIWAQSYDRTIEHAFAVEGEVAQTVANSLKVALLPAQIEKLNALPTQNPAAYDAYLKGQYAYDQAWKNPGDYQKAFAPAIARFQEAITLDPQFALAYAVLARAELNQEYFGHLDGGATRRPELFVSAKQNIDQALQLQPELPIARLALADWHYTAQHDQKSALDQYRRVLTQDPQLTDAAFAIAEIAIDRGDSGQAIDVVNEALAHDPRNFQLLRILGTAYSLRRDYASAYEVISRALVIDPADQTDASNLCLAIVNNTGDLGAIRHVLDSLLAHLPPGQPLGAATTDSEFTLLLYSRDFAAARKYVDGIPAENWRSDWQRLEVLGAIERYQGHTEKARAFFGQARVALQAAILKDPNEPESHADLASVDSEMGLSDEALREAQTAVDLQPLEKHPFAGVQWVVNLASVNAQLGRVEEAVTILQRLLVTPNTGVDISVWLLRLDPQWDPLRNDPRFQKLIASPPRA